MHPTIRQGGDWANPKTEALYHRLKKDETLFKHIKMLTRAAHRLWINIARTGVSQGTARKRAAVWLAVRIRDELTAASRRAVDTLLDRRRARGPEHRLARHRGAPLHSTSTAPRTAGPGVLSSSMSPMKRERRWRPSRANAGPARVAPSLTLGCRLSRPRPARFSPGTTSWTPSAVTQTATGAMSAARPGKRTSLPCVKASGSSRSTTRQVASSSVSSPSPTARRRRCICRTNAGVVRATNGFQTQPTEQRRVGAYRVVSGPVFGPRRPGGARADWPSVRAFGPGPSTPLGSLDLWSLLHGLKKNACRPRKRYE